MKNNYEIRGEITAIFINSPKFGLIETLIDTEDLEKLKCLNAIWRVNQHQSFYVVRHVKINEKMTTEKLHRFLMSNPKGLVIDHINHNTLDNRKVNLRAVTNCQNLQNRKGATTLNKTGIRGVQYIEKTKKWRARVCVNGRDIHLGVFDNQYEAEKAVKEGLKRYLPFAN